MSKKQNNSDCVSMLQIQIDKAQHILSLAQTTLEHIQNLEGPSSILKMTEGYKGFEPYEVWTQMHESVASKLQIFKVFKDFDLSPQVRERLDKFENLHIMLADTVNQILTVFTDEQNKKYN